MNAAELAMFTAVVAALSALGFLGHRFRRSGGGLEEWAIAGRRFGPVIIWFLLGADVFTAYTLVSVPSLAFASGAIVFFTVPYAVTFLVAYAAMPRLWSEARRRGHLTAAELVADIYGSRALGVAVAVTGIVAVLPYMAVQIDGMRAVLEVLLQGVSSPGLVSELSLLLAFAVLAAFTYRSGLRGSALGAVLKDALLWLTVVVMAAVVISRVGGFQGLFSGLSRDPLPTGTLTLRSDLYVDYLSLALGSALALYLYPHVINGVMSSQSPKTIRTSTALLPLYVIAVGVFSFLGFAAYLMPGVLRFVSQFPASQRGLLVVPAMAQLLLPSPLAAVILAGIFIGGMVPAAIMAIAQSNLLVRGIVRPLARLSPEGEEAAAKWASVLFKFLALGFVFVTPLTYAIQLQLLGGIIVLQTLPPVMLSLVIRRLDPRALLAGLAAGLASGVYLTLLANRFGPIRTTSIAVGGVPVFVGLIALAVNLVVVLAGSAAASLLARGAP
ncbi:sodium:solute symporter family protein [Acidilobus saccharovorans]|nr:sodium:solute symporter [Acidilobus saccharovorans]